MTMKPRFTPSEERVIFQATRSQVLAAVGHRKRTEEEFAQSLGSLASVPVLGTFVSFKKGGSLRSCMGWMNEGVPLAEALRRSALSAALDDPRFPPIDRSELDQLSMEVWVLWGMETVPQKGEARLESFEIGRHGLRIRSGNRCGLLLPGVAIEWKFTPKQFLEAVCRKAGLAANAWRDDSAVLERFEGLAIQQEFFDSAAREEMAKISAVQESETKSNASSGGYSWNIPFFSSRTGFKSKTETAAEKSIQQQAETVRPAAVAGMFYPKGASAQKQMLDTLFAVKEPITPSPAEAVLIPHAGWIYSGQLAAQTLLRTEMPESILIIAPKHRPEGGNRAVAPNGIWDYSGGRLRSDRELAARLVREMPSFRFDEDSHRREHAIEVQLPLFARCRADVRVAGVVLGADDPAEIIEQGRLLGKMLRTMEKRPLLVISSDMNHFADEEKTHRLDAMAMAAIETLEPEELARTVLGNRISMCGIFPAILIMAALRETGCLHEAERVGYTTSAEASGDRSRVVGYAGYRFR